MSYYTVIREAIALIKPEEPKEVGVILEIFEQDGAWAIAALFSYILIFGLALSLFARSKDQMDLLESEQMEEGVENIPDA